jgi:hypothetical protein
MNNNFNDSNVNKTPDSLADIMADLTSNNSLGFSADNTNQTDPKKQKGNTVKTETPTDNQTLGEQPVEIKRRTSEGMSKFTTNRVVTGAERNTGVNLDELAGYLNTDFISSKEAAFGERARAQSNWAQARNAMGRLAVNVLPEVAANIIGSFDVNSYYENESQVSNHLLEKIREFQQGAKDAMPIYRENEGKSLDIGDPAYWFETGESLLTSIGGFVGAGYVTGGIAGGTFSKGAQLAKYIKTLGKTSQLGARAQQGVRTATTLSNAFLLNNAEAFGVGLDTFEESYNTNVKMLRADEKYKDVSDAEIASMAKQKASEAAASAINFNRLNILLNITSANMFLKTPINTRVLIDAPNKLKSLRQIGLEGGQEFLEEEINLIAQKRALADNYTFKDALTDIATDEGIEAGILGFIGGAGQTALTKAGKYLPINKNIEYRQAFSDAYQTFKSQGMSSEESQAKAREIALKKVGNDKSYISDNSIRQKRYTQQQVQIAENQKRSKLNKVNDFTNVFYTAQEETELYNELATAQEAKDQVRVEDLTNRLLYHQATKNFELGTTDSLIELYKSFEELSEEEAEEKGIYNRQDKGTNNYYKTRAKEAIKTIETLEKKFIESKAYLNSDQVYGTSIELEDIKKLVKQRKEEALAVIQEANERFKYKPEFAPGDSYLVNGELTRESINKVKPRFRQTATYRKFKELVLALDILQNTNSNIQLHFDNITSKEYQGFIKDAIAKNKEAKKEQEKLQKTIAKKSADRKDINALKKSIDKKAVSPIEDVVVAPVVAVDPVVVDTKATPVNTPTPKPAPVVQPDNVPTATVDKKYNTGAVRSIDFPVFGEADLDSTLNSIKQAVENPNINVKDLLTSITAFRVSFAQGSVMMKQSYPLLGDSIDITNKTLVDIENQLKAELNAINQKNLDLSQSVNDFFGNLADIKDENPTMDFNPNNNVDFNEVLKQAQALTDILRKLEGLNINIRDIKEVSEAIEGIIGKETFIKNFVAFKNIYNVATKQNIEGTYEEVLNDTKANKTLVNRFNKVAIFSIPKGLYNFQVDDITKDNLAIYRDMAKLNGVDVTGNGFVFKRYNETGSNLLAYLAKSYKDTFKVESDNKTNIFVRVGKQDLNNFLNTNFDKRILDPKFLNVDTEITFVPLDSIVEENGDVRTRENSTIDDAPIGIMINGELIEGLYLHDVSWVNLSNLDSTIEAVKQDQEALRALRSDILTSNKTIVAKITERSPGVPIVDNSNELNPVSTNMPDVQIAISKAGKLFYAPQKVVATANRTTFDEGKTVVVIPFGKKKLALPVRRAKVREDYIDSIASVIELFLNKTKTPLVDEIQKLYGVNILTNAGLETYLNNFVQLTYTKAENLTDFNNYLETVREGISLISVRNGIIYYGYGLNDKSNYIGSSKNYSKETLAQDLAHFREHLKNSYFNVDINKLGSKEVPFLISNNKLIKPYENYNDFAKDNLLTSYLSIDVDGKPIYTIQSRLNFAVTKAVENVGEEFAKKVNAEAKENEGVPTRTKGKDIKLSDGSIFNIDNIDFDANPNDSKLKSNNNTIADNNLDKNSHDYLLANSSIIKGVNVSTFNNFIESIASRIYSELLEERDTEGFKIDVEQQVKVTLNGLEGLKDAYLQAFNMGRDIDIDTINFQIDSIVANKSKIIKAVERRLSKKGISASENELNNNTVKDAEEDERNTWLDTALYTIDPRTSLTKEIKNFLEGIKEYNVVDVNGENQFYPKKSILNNDIIVPFDKVYISLNRLLTKSNTNPITLTYDKVIALLEEEVDGKPYYHDIINKLKDSEPHFKNAFVTAFSKHHTNHLYVSVNYDSTKKEYNFIPTLASAKNVTDLVLSEWQNNLKNKDIFITEGNKIKINSDNIKEFEALYNEIVADSTKVYKVKDWLEMVGIVIPPIVHSNLLNYGMYRDDQVYSLYQHFILSNGIFKNIKNTIVAFSNNNEEIEEDNDLDLSTMNLYDDSSFKDLAFVVSRYRDDLFNDNFKNGNGDTVYSYANNKYVVDRFINLKDDAVPLKYLLDVPYSASSTWLANLYQIDEDTNEVSINKHSLMYKYFKYYTADSIKYKNSKIGKVIDKLTPEQLEDFQLGLYYNRGLHANGLPIMKVLYPTMSDKSNVFILQVPRREYTFVNGVLPSETKLELAKILFYPEIDRINHFNANKGTFNNLEYEQGGGKFLSFPLLNDVKELWNEDGTLVEGVGKTAEFDAILIEYVTRYLSKLVSEKRALWQEYGIIKRSKDNKKSYIKVDKVYKAVKGDDLDNILKNYVINTTIANLNIQQLFIGDPALFYKTGKTSEEMGINTANTMGKRLGMDNGGKSPIISDKDETMNVLVIDDVKMTSTALSYLNSLFGVNSDIPSLYKDIDAADGQEFTTLAEHLKILFKRGEITKAKMNSILSTYDKTGLVDKEDLGIILQPMKPLYGNNFLRNGIDYRVHIKSSSYPLIKQLTVNTPLDKIRVLMETESIDRVAFASAVKIGKPRNIPKLFTKDGKDVIIPKNWKDGLLDNIPREGHGIQQVNPYDEEKNHVNDGTQQSKMLFTNLLDIKGFVHPETGEKVDGRTLLTSYNGYYGKLFENKYNKLINDLEFNPITGTINNMNKLREILIKEGLARNYNINDINSLELNELGTAFATPLWLNNSENKISALLNSIVDNQVRKRKFKGKSFILASEAGIRLDKTNTNIQTLDSIDENAIIRVPGWNGELTATKEVDGTITYAEILVPFKFWDNDGNALSVKDFMVDGMLDLTKIPEKALESFGYRIPTQGLNSMSLLKVVGFLPDVYGDIIVAPLDFVRQMGSDFDVDKLYTHMYNTYFDKTSGSFEILSDIHIKRRQNVLKSLETLRNHSRDLKKAMKIEKHRNLKIDIANRITIVSSQIRKLKQGAIYKYVGIEDDLLQNKILDVHFAVLDNPAKEVQTARANPLGLGNLKELVSKIPQAKSSADFTSFSNTYQSSKYLRARAGKSAVGLFSLDNVFNALIQHIPVNMNFYRYDKKLKREVDYSVNIAGFNNSDLNNPHSVEKGKYKSDVISAFQSAALDDENEQLLGKLNINSDTFDVIRVMALMGFTEDIIVPFINQPSVLAFNKGLTDVPSYNPEYRTLLKTTTLNEMIEALNGEADTQYQNAVLYFFNDFKTKGEVIKVIQSTLNSDSKGVGKNLFYSLQKADQIIKLPEYDKQIRGVSKLIGDYEYSSPIEDGFVRYGDTWIRPTTISGFAGVYGVLFNNVLWNKHYPYNKGNIRDILSNLINIRFGNVSTVNEEADLLNKATNEFKSFLVSNTYHLLGKDNNIYDTRYKLLYDTETHDSLGTIILDLRQRTGALKPYTNPLLEKLQIGRSTMTATRTGKIPTEIKYYNAGVIEMNDEVIINSIIDMLVNDIYLGDYNGERLTTRILAEQLIQYQLVTGGVQQSAQFIKYIPYDYLKTIGFYKEMEATANLLDNDEFSKNAKEAFTTQYVQHNPEEFYNERVLENFEIVNNKLVAKDRAKIFRSFVVFPSAMPNKYRIFKFIPDIQEYIEIDVLGSKGMKEYDITLPFAGKSTIYINQADSGFERLNDKVEEEVQVIKKEYIPKITSINPPVTSQEQATSLSDFTNHSGGAYGGDTFWDIIGRPLGFTKHNHYKDAGNANLSQQLRNNKVTAVVLSKEQMDKARSEVERLLGKKYPNTLEGNLQVRNFYQVYNSDAVYAIAKLNSNNKSVSGGTNTAIQLGIKLNKPVYVWDINTEQWYKFNNKVFEKTETPILTKNFAGIGSRDIENYNVKKDDKWQPRQEYVGKEKEDKAKQAIKDVYVVTKNSINTLNYSTPTVSNTTSVQLDLFSNLSELSTENLPQPGTATDEFLSLDNNVSDLSSAKIYNTAMADLTKKYYLDDNSLAVEEKYRLILRQIRNNSNNPIIKYFADKIKGLTPLLSAVPFYVDTNLKARGVLLKSNMFAEPFQIRVNPNSFVSEEDLHLVVIEEIIHGITAMEVEKGSSTFVKELEALRKSVENDLINTYGQKAIDRVKYNSKHGLGLTTELDRNILYPIINLQEFIAASINNKLFQEYLNKPANEKAKTLWQRFIKAITDLLQRLGVKKDSNLEAVLHEILNLFENDITKDPAFYVPSVPLYVRTQDYLNKKLNLVNENNVPIQKDNAQEIVDFINKNIVNVVARNIDGRVVLDSNRFADFAYDENIGLTSEIVEGGVNSFPNYIKALEIRVKKLKSSIKKARDIEDFNRVAVLQEQYNKDAELLENAGDVKYLDNLADFAEQDLQTVEEMLKRPLTSEDLVYARSLTNFWKDSTELLFSPVAKKSKILTNLYAGIESEAKSLSDQLSLVEKEYLRNFVKTYINRDITIDEIFSEFKDINSLQNSFKDISTYDNELLTSIWAAVQTANIKAEDDFNKQLEGFEELSDKVLANLKARGYKELFDIFRQRTENGKLTGHLVNQYSKKFYERKAMLISGINANNVFSNFNAYLNHIGNIGLNTNIASLFPANNVITPEVIAAREALKQELGEYAYNSYMKNQQKKIDSYNEHKEGYLEILVSSYNLKSKADITNTEETNRKYENWLKANSPYSLEHYAFKGAPKSIEDYKYFNSHKYYELIPKREAVTADYFDSNFDIIKSDETLLAFYEFVNDTFSTLKKFVPDSQQEALAYGGIPFIEKSLYEMYSEKGFQLGFKPIQDAFIKSMQSSFSDNSSGVIDPNTGKPVQEMRIPMIKNNYEAIKDIVEKKTVEFIVENKREPNNVELYRFKEEAIDEISQQKSFDLPKVIKVYTALVMAHKHKAQIEDGIKIATTVMDSYKESFYRPDGTPITAGLGLIQKKPTAESFVKTKQATENFIKANMYNDIRDEEGKGGKVLTPTEKATKKELENSLIQLEEDLANNVITVEVYTEGAELIQDQLAKLGKTFIYSKAGDNLLKYLQVKLMGWNVLSGFSNMGFGWIANYIEAAGGQVYTKESLNYGYKLVMNSIGRNASFNHETGLYDLEVANKIRAGMNKWDVLKDASNELYTESTPNSFNKRFRWLSPYNMQKRTEYINQAPLLIALAKDTKVQTEKGETTVWDAMDNDFNWNTAEFGEEPKDVIIKLRLKLNQIIKRNHGNYDPASTINAKRSVLGRFALQFRTWMIDAIAVRVEKERFDDILGVEVKGRYRSVGDVYKRTTVGEFALEFMKGILRRYTFGAYKGGTFEGLVENNKIKAVDAANMRKVLTEVTMAINLNLLLLVVAGLKDDDDDEEKLQVLNVLINQGIRLRTDLMLYVNPMEARNLIRDIIPAVSIVKEVADFFYASGKALIGEDEFEAGIHAGDSRLVKASSKLLPFTSKAYSIYNSASQTYDKR